ncbi:LysR family transcriptional regulator [Labrys neptuniae]
MDKLAGMAMFVRVVEQGSFAAAAETSRVSPTMVAKHIRLIEARLGARILHRTTRRHQLTEVGRLYYDRCRTVLAEVALAEASASELQASPRGRLRLAAPVSFGSESLTPALVEYMQANPEVSVDLVLDNRAPDLIGDGCELGIHIGELTDETLVARPLKPYRRILAAAPSYLDRRGRPVHPRDLSGHNCLGHAYWRTQGVWQLVGPGEEACSVAVSGRFTTNQGSALRAAALHGAGIVLQPEVLLSHDLEAARLEAVLPQWSYKPTPMHLIYAPDRRPTAMLRSAIDFLVARFG